jgi:nitroreductase
MDTIEAIMSRRSVRDFKSDPIPRAIVLKILEAANRCPSTANTRPWQMYVAGGKVLDEIRQACMARFAGGESIKPDIPLFQEWPPVLKARIDQNRGERFKLLGIDRQDKAALKANQGLNYQFFGAPVAIFLCMDRTLGAWSIFDIGALTQTILLAATHYGLGSVPALNFVGYPDIIRKEMQIPEDLAVVFGVALGYPDPRNPINQYHSARQPIEEIVTIKGF